MKKIILLMFLFLVGNIVSAQCAFDSTITSDPDLSGGNQVQCSDQVIVFTAPAGYDSYQWKYKFSPGGTPTDFTDETNNTLSIVAGDLGFAYVFVTITDDGCTEDSNEILFDTWIFLNPAIEHDPDTTLCFGESSIISNAFAGPSLFRWLKDGEIVYEGPQDFYEVFEAGSYLLEVSYPQCPQFWLSSGVPVVFDVVGEEVEIEEVDGVLYTTENGLSYKWFLEDELIDGADTFFYTPLESGNYTVEVGFQASPICLVTSESFFFDFLSLSSNALLDEVYFINTISKNNEFVLKNTQNLSLNITLYDTNGRLLSNTTSSEEFIVISSEMLKSGIFFCKIEMEGKVKSVSLIK
ncbi:MAG: T9SS type A sorting domain-containing protein [Flavobacteriaceae bacterium]|nr:T9SS type A sorting domain-containing protein [Flavobacteriaceae bacterium]